ncbi:Protein of unknown function [Pyronema omphalodes CBS 100304]|uniref:Uncharacterized protein n=1 Tax=Pyronema omphalodes (strain CBS 100304) TaxID=1076935 RepID=U4LAT3_PYROM|nr:Protein of unknown function [Pyronema omphalodes CBS 100304]
MGITLSYLTSTTAWACCSCEMSFPLDTHHCNFCDKHRCPKCSLLSWMEMWRYQNPRFGGKCVDPCRCQ